MAGVRTYYELTKPGIIQGNLLAAATGFFVAAHTTNTNLALLIELAVAVALVIAAACVINNYIDRGIDRAMARTHRRALASRSLPARRALSFAAVLGIAGFIVLGLFTNWVTFAVGVVGFVDYVAVYGWAKRRSWHGTLIGSIAGSMPLVAGYTAVTGRFDSGALLLFLLMACWQMPHFYAIALRRLSDYRAAGLPVLPAVKGSRATILQVVGYIAAFMVVLILLYALGYIGRFCVLALGLYAAIWLSRALKGLSVSDHQRWAKQMFLYSLVFLPLAFVTTLLELWVA